MAISTKKGDYGTTSLLDGSTVEKSNTYIECLGLCDELAVALGSIHLLLIDMALSKNYIPNKDKYSAEASAIENIMMKHIETIQQNIFNLGANIASKFNGQYIVGDIDSDIKLVDDIEILAIKAGESVTGDDVKLNQYLSDVEHTLCELSAQIVILEKVDAKSLKYIYKLLDALHRNGISSQRSIIPDTRTIITDIVNTLDELRQDNYKTQIDNLKIDKQVQDTINLAINEGLIVFTSLAKLILDDTVDEDTDIENINWIDKVTVFDNLSENLNKDFTMKQFVYPSENWLSYKFDTLRVNVRKLERLLIKTKITKLHNEEIHKIVNRASDVFYLAGRIVGEDNIKFVEFKNSLKDN